MDQSPHSPQTLARLILAGEPSGRRIVALAGPPASGKSTLAAELVEALKAVGSTAQCVPMDGFHLDNALLNARGLLARKGAPETFDAAGFVHLVQRLKRGGDVVYPVFDRTRDIAVAGAGCVEASCDVVVVEGNYLLFDADPWRDLAPLWDISIRLAPRVDVLRARLMSRWIDHGLSMDDARQRAEGNDLRNAKLIETRALSADIIL